MVEVPMRRTQVVTTYGAGSLINDQKGETSIVGALDYWFHTSDGTRATELASFEILEPRLKNYLKVDHLYAPPAFKRKSYGEGDELAQLYIPLLRFPTWHYCAFCKSLYQLSLVQRTSKTYCKKCEKQRHLIQVPFLIICDKGHLSDFPWKEWAHRDDETDCRGTLYLRSTGNATLDSLKVGCSCGIEPRSLKGIMTVKGTEDEENTRYSELSKRMNKNKEFFTCTGAEPWKGKTGSKGGCPASPVAVLRNSLNIYYPNKISSLYIPGENKNVNQIISIFKESSLTPSMIPPLEGISAKIDYLKKLLTPNILDDFDPKEIEEAILYIEGNNRDLEWGNESIERKIRGLEYESLLKENTSDELKISKVYNSLNSKDPVLGKIHQINKVTRLRETICLVGFDRLSSNNYTNDEEKLKLGKTRLFKNPKDKENNWLPATASYGEGIFVTLNIEKIKEWGNNTLLQDYVSKVHERFNKGLNTVDEFYDPKNILLHTLSHLLIDEISITAGYSTTSIRERLYIDDEQIGLLIYTSADDMEGTFGGLVRLGDKDILLEILKKSINRAKWCSSDPVCTEIGNLYGQGINKVNGAACHNCAYLPETSCQFQNQYLDRTLLIDEDFGFFKDI